MGYLLKEALKILCGSNRWSYAAFWKIGCKNPKLLIWEECHYEPSQCPFPPHIAGIGSANLPSEGWEGCFSSESQSSHLGNQEEDRVCSLVDKMMVNNQVNLVGEGLVGRAAFTGSHQWIILNNCARDVHPPEVLNELHLQFSAGMQTVAVIPVLPHGVLQLGSPLIMMENWRFVDDVKSLILQLGCVPGALVPDNYETEVSAKKFSGPFDLGVSASVVSTGFCQVTSSTPLAAGSSNLDSHLSYTSKLINQPCHSLMKETNNHMSSVSTHQTPLFSQILPVYHEKLGQSKAVPAGKPNFGLLENGVVGVDVIPSEIDAWSDHNSAISNSQSRVGNLGIIGQSCASQSMQRLEDQFLLVNGIQSQVNFNASSSNALNTSQLRTNGGNILDHHLGSVSIALMGGSQIQGGLSCHLRPNGVSLLSTHQSWSGIQMDHSIKTDGVVLPDVACKLSAMQSELVPTDKRIDDDLFQALNISVTQPGKDVSINGDIHGFVNSCSKNGRASQTYGMMNVKNEEICAQPPSGDDLYDVLGAEFKNKLLSGNLNKLLTNERDAIQKNQCKSNLSSMNMTDKGPACSASGGCSGTGSDHLLDVVVSRAQSTVNQCSDDDVSCRTTMTRISTSSVRSSSLDYKQASMTNHLLGELHGIPNIGGKVSALESSSFRSGCIKKDGARYCSQTTSTYGSQLSSWVEQGSNLKHDSGVSTAYSKQPDEVSKSNRKRPKLGENPRPRPKDRQMIQDRVKELREIVPNGTKCSIDALLERTIKHMLFLQSITKHADKLKQAGESKLINKEGQMLLKDNFEGGATWAYKVGSRPMVFPIIVEDLNLPSQMLVEMLCEERGFFLEIADLIRGLGLTILKGVIEAQDDKIWARFAVETNRDVTRMEIFMALVGLLEQTGKSSASSLNATDTMMAYHSFPQVTEIPATGRPSSL